MDATWYNTQMEVGQYRVIDKIGEGGAGVVYKAEHTLTEQIVALKELSRELSMSADMKERFIREAKIQAKLNHKNIVRLYNFIEQDGVFYLIMEYMEGKRLDHIIKEKTPMDYGKCLEYFKQILDGVGFAHSHGIIHRDIKPANIIVDNDETVKIMDFGIARGQDDVHLTKTGTSMGTLRYMAPEQVRGEKAGVQSDIYSLGMTLYEMVTGTTPFKSNSAYHLMKEIVDENISPPAKFRDAIPEAVENAIMKACAKNPSDRFDSTSEFSKALDALEHPIYGGKTQNYTTILPEFHKSASKKNKTALKIALPVLIIIGVIAGMLTFGNRKIDISGVTSKPVVQSTPGNTTQPPPAVTPHEETEKNIEEQPEENKPEKTKHTTRKKRSSKTTAYGSKTTTSSPSTPSPTVEKTPTPAPTPTPASKHKDSDEESPIDQFSPKRTKN